MRILQLAGNDLTHIWWKLFLLRVHLCTSVHPAAFVVASLFNPIIANPHQTENTIVQDKQTPQLKVLLSVLTVESNRPEGISKFQVTLDQEDSMQ